MGQFFKAWGRRRARQKKEVYEKLGWRLKTLQLLKEMDKDVEEDLRLVKEKRKVFMNEKGKSIVFQAKIQHMEQDEKCTRFFFKKMCGKKKMCWYQ